MNTATLHTPSWRTSSLGHAAQILPDELATLGVHLDLCRRSSGKLFVLRCHAESVKRLVSSRIVSTCMLVALTVAIGTVMF